MTPPAEGVLGAQELGAADVQEKMGVALTGPGTGRSGSPGGRAPGLPWAEGVGLVGEGLVRTGKDRAGPLGILLACPGVLLWCPTPAPGSHAPFFPECPTRTCHVQKEHLV